MRKGFTLIELMIVIAIIAIIASIAIPNLLESRVTANESASAASLKSGIFPAQVQFMSGGYLDIDLDNVGEAGTLRQLSGIAATNKSAAGALKCLTGPLASPASYNTAAGVITAPNYGEASGFRYAGYAASVTSAAEVTTTMNFENIVDAVPVALDPTTGTTANNGERLWTVGCVPASFGDTGRRVFVIGADGQTRSPADPLVLAVIYTGAPVAGAQGTALILAGAIATNYDKLSNPTTVPKPVPALTAPANNFLDSDTTAANPSCAAHYPIFAK